MSKRYEVGDMSADLEILGAVPITAALRLTATPTG
jgi:hypothetical protein